MADILGRVLEHRHLFARSIESERRVDEKRTIVECLSEASPHGVLFIDHAGEVFFFNRQFVRMWSLEAEPAVRARDLILRAAAEQVVDPAAFMATLKPLEDRVDYEIHDEVELRDGRFFERQVRPVRSTQDVFYGYALFFRDVTARKKREAERERLLATERAAREAAEDAIRARDDFLSVASHELRTPLTSLLLSTEQVIRAARDLVDVPPSVLRALETPRRQAERLVGLVDALLDVTRIQAGRLDLEREESDLGEIVRDVVGRFQHEIDRTRSQVAIRTEGSATGLWDRSRLDQVVSNLLANAIKYGGGGRIDLAVTGEGDTVRLDVRDRGIGIAPEMTGRLFQRFERAASTRQYGGLGLGLFIARQIVEMHGGTVRVTSEPKVGSTFTVSLPRR